MEKDSIKRLREQITRETQEKSKMACVDSTMPLDSPPVLAREEMVPYKHMQNLGKLPLGSTHTVVAAYFDSVDGRTPPRWSSTSFISFPDCSGSFRRSCIINTNCFDGFQ